MNLHRTLVSTWCIVLTNSCIRGRGKHRRAMQLEKGDREAYPLIAVFWSKKVLVTSWGSLVNLMIGFEVYHSL
jgi:hypothetical protein